MWQFASALIVGTVLALPALAIPSSMDSCERPTRLHPDSPLLTKGSRLLVGNKGEETITLPDTEANCSKAECWTFDHAEIVISEQRFGSAAFTSLPQAGCRRCKPIKVRWYHEPTGYIAFDVRVYQRNEHADCVNAHSKPTSKKL